MTKKREIYRCTTCGNMVEVMIEGAGELVCCGKPMKRLEANTVDASQEKHVPVVEEMEGGLKVKVGSIPHPMTESHFIQWIELVTPSKVLRHELKPNDEPEALFITNEQVVCVREYCNLHGLWKK